MDNSQEEDVKLEKKKKRYKKNLKLNLMSLFFAGVSFISITLAWFAYSGLVTTEMEIDVKAWYIEFTKGDESVSNNVVISLSDISPGMSTISETIDIKNMGDTDAAISYEITSARILDETIESNGEEGYVEDILSHNYPFHININLSDYYANAHDGSGEFIVSVSWPLDGGNDTADSEWGVKAYSFQKENPDKAPLEIIINLKAAQYLGDSESADTNYRLGNIVLYNPTTNSSCTEISETCLKTHVIDKNNTLGDTTVTLLPDLTSTTFTSQTGTNYSTSFAYQTARALALKDILPIVSKDVVDTVIMSDSLSNIVVGYLDYENRLENHIKNTILINGTYRFTTLNFTYFKTSSCVWLNNEYGTDTKFALNKLDETYSKLYAESNYATCLQVPVFEVSKNNL